MWKIQFVAEEFFRSFHKNLLKNLLLMAMFSISLVMTVIMGSYYFDLGDRYREVTRQVGDRTWCDLDLMTENKDEIENSLMTVTGCRNMMDYYETLRSSEECPVISLDTPIIYVKEDDINRYFGDKSHLGFLVEWQSESFMLDFEEEGTCSVLNMNCAQVDLGAYRYFGLRTQEGKGFTEQNMTLESWTDPIPIVLGSNYKGIIEPGTELKIWYWGFVYSCKVVGILEKGMTIPEYGASSNSGVCQLDSRILLPFGIQVSEPVKTVDEIKKIAYLSYLSLHFGIAQVPDGKLREQTAVFRDAGKEFGLPAVQIVGTSMGVNLLRKESSASVMILLILSVTLSCFTLYGIFVTFYDKIQSNSKIYGIYMLNGCSMSMILVLLILEIAVILVPAVFVSRFMFMREGMDYQPEVIMRVTYVIAGLVFAVGIGVIVFMMRGVDTEHLIRQKD